MGGGGDYVSFLLLSWFRVEPGVDLSKQNHEGLSSQCRCSSMQIWFCGWGGAGRRRGLSPPTALIQQLLQSLISLSLLIHLQPSTCFHSQVCFNSHQSVLIKPLPPFSHAARSIFTHKDFQTSRSTCVFLPLSLSLSHIFPTLSPLLNGQISAGEKKAAVNYRCASVSIDPLSEPEKRKREAEKEM